VQRETAKLASRVYVPAGVRTPESAPEARGLDGGRRELRARLWSSERGVLMDPGPVRLGRKIDGAALKFKVF
jgi:hypothetical protein